MASRKAKWWGIGLGLAAVLLVGTILLVWWGRRSAIRELERQLALSPADEAWLASLPVLTDAQQSRVQVIHRNQWPNPDVPFRGGVDWAFRGQPPDPGLLERHELCREHADRLAELLAVEGICLSGAAFARRPDGELRAYDDPLRTMGNLLVSRGMATWLGLEVLLVEDPEPVLVQLDRLEEALRPVAGIIDAMIHASVVYERDSAHLRCAVQGRLSAARRARWLAEPSRTRALSREAQRAERVLALAPIARDTANGDPRALRMLYGDDASFVERFEWQVRDPGRYLRSVEAVRFAEACVEADDFGPVLTGPDAPSAEDPWALRPEGLLWTILTQRAAQRLMRLAAELQALGEAAPADEAALQRDHPELAARMQSGPWDLALAYERLSPTRIRVFVSPTTPLPVPFGGRRAELPTRGVTTTEKPKDPMPVLDLRFDDIRVDLRR